MILVDTSFFVALIAARDRHHEEAVGLVRAHARAGLLTSNHVRGETWTFLNARYGHRTGVRFLDLLERSASISVADVGPRLERQALGWLRRHDERTYSFVDATSFALMKAERIREALTFDGDFAAAGFVELRL